MGEYHGIDYQFLPIIRHVTIENNFWKLWLLSSTFFDIFLYENADEIKQSWNYCYTDKYPNMKQLFTSNFRWKLFKMGICRFA